jgi:hypothetical protein
MIEQPQPNTTSHQSFTGQQVADGITVLRRPHERPSRYPTFVGVLK